MTLRRVLLILLVLAASGCGLFRSGSKSESSSKPAQRRWLKGVLPPPGEYFTDERSHEIERSLRRQTSSLHVD